MANADLPDLMDLRDVLVRLRGKIGRTALLEHLAAYPVFAGEPTHGRLGRRYRFTPDQYVRLVESLAKPEGGARSKALRTPGGLLSSDQIANSAVPFDWRGPVIYFLVANKRVVYVGQTTNFPARIAQHSKRITFDSYCFIRCDKSRLIHLERAYIDALLPDFNRDAITEIRRSGKAYKRIFRAGPK